MGSGHTGSRNVIVENAFLSLQSNEAVSFYFAAVELDVLLN